MTALLLLRTPRRMCQSTPSTVAEGVEAGEPGRLRGGAAGSSRMNITSPHRGTFSSCYVQAAVERPYNKSLIHVGIFSRTFLSARCSKLSAIGSKLSARKFLRVLMIFCTVFPPLYSSGVYKVSYPHPHGGGGAGGE